MEIIPDIETNPFYQWTAFRTADGVMVETSSVGFSSIGAQIGFGVGAGVGVGVGVFIDIESETAQLQSKAEDSKQNVLNCYWKLCNRKCKNANCSTGAAYARCMGRCIPKI